jgi:hypothetical protein
VQPKTVLAVGEVETRQGLDALQPVAPGVTSYSAAEIRLLDQGLRRHGAATLARINGTRFDRSSASQLGSEEGSYTPATRTINMVAKAFSGTRSPTGASPPGSSPSTTRSATRSLTGTRR